MRPLRVAITGVESTGKSTLANFIANQLGGVVVPEFAREYLNQYGPGYTAGDLDKIAEGQAIRQQDAASLVEPLVVYDTDLTVLKIWSEVRYGAVSDVISKLLKAQQVDLFLLPYFDIPWVFDPLRENEHNRRELFEMYLNELEDQAAPFAIIRGSAFDRNYLAFRTIRKFL